MHGIGVLPGSEAVVSQGEIIGAAGNGRAVPAFVLAIPPPIVAPIVFTEYTGLSNPIRFPIPPPMLERWS